MSAVAAWFIICFSLAAALVPVAMAGTPREPVWPSGAVLVASVTLNLLMALAAAHLAGWVG